jgi:cob(I)alamin adenosyltransferase
MSISTQRGDDGQTSLPNRDRVSKDNPRVEAYGTIDELISSLGLARSICQNAEIRDLTKSIQRELFRIGSAIAGPQPPGQPKTDITDEMVDRLTQQVRRIEKIEGILGDWSLPGEDPVSAAYDVARTVCRRAERLAVRVRNDGIEIEPNVFRYLNRLSDLLWLFGRLIEVEQGIDSSLRDGGKGRWTRAW